MAGAIEFDAELSGQDVAALMRQMKASAKALNLSMAKSVKFTGWSVSRSLGAATQEAPKKRKIKEVTGEKTRRGNKVFEVERWHRGRKSTFRVFARNKREASKLPQVKIALAKLAKKSWHWTQRKMGSSVGGAKVGAEANRLARRHGTVELHLRGDNPWLRINNTLEYILSAFKTSGQQLLSNVVERAARGMQKTTADKVARKMGAR
jgi:hypothetical protein